MDKNSLLGLLLIGGILFAYTWYSRPSEDEIAQMRRTSDSIAQVEREKEAQYLAAQQSKIKGAGNAEADSLVAAQNDSLVQLQSKAKFGAFGDAAQGETKFITLKNDKVTVKLSTLGGRMFSVKLNEFKTFNQTDLILFTGDQNKFNFLFYAENKEIRTEELFFEPVNGATEVIADSEAKSVSMRLHAGEGRYLEYVYTLEPNSYIVDFDVNFVGVNDLIGKRHNFIDMDWAIDVPISERGKDWESDNSSIYYKYDKSEEVDQLSERSDDDATDLNGRVKWVAFKDQFFSSILIAENYIESGVVNAIKLEESQTHTKHFGAKLTFPFESKAKETIPIQFYFGPNHYKTLKQFDQGFEELVPLGWGIFGWINRLAIIPLFNYLGSSFANYGLIIFLMTVIIKMFLFPLTYKSYKSTAKMRVLKPQIEEINSRIPKDKAMERQKATMELYRKVGVNPAGGCIPMLLQFPILIAMFRFFPASIELRQKSFLWATDLSSYDAILTWSTHIPFLSDIYGNHMSLFTLLMAASVILTTIVNSGQMDTNSQMPGMKTMMYLMPVMMIFWFNKYSSGLSFYYFVSNLITFGQTLLIRRFVDDEAILKKLKENKAKPKKQSKFQARIAEMQKMQQQQAKGRSKRN